MKADQEFVADEDEDQELEQSLGELDEGRTIDLGAEGPEEEPLAELRYREAVDMIRALLDGQDVDLGKLGALSDVEREALEYLQSVIKGRRSGGAFMYAEDRLEGLNQVLAQLQPLLSVGALHEVLSESLGEVVDGFAALRDKLALLEEAQEEIFHAPEVKQGEGEDGEDDGGGEGDEAEGAVPKQGKGKGEGEGEAEAGGEVPRKSTVWDPDDRGAA